MPLESAEVAVEDEVYAVLAYLHLGNVVPDNFTLSDKNIAEVLGGRMPNRTA
ncbi:MAG: hypothetical protein U1F00_02375 [Rhodoferax sp.]